MSPEHSAQLKYYSVKDSRSESNPDDDYKYAFNVCGPVLEIPEGCSEDDIKTYNNGQPRQFCEDNQLHTNDTTGEVKCKVEMKSVGDVPGIYVYINTPTSPQLIKMKLKCARIN